MHFVQFFVLFSITKFLAIHGILWASNFLQKINIYENITQSWIYTSCLFSVPLFPKTQKKLIFCVAYFIIENTFGLENNSNENSI